MWILFAFSAPAFYALAEILDNFLANKEIKHPATLVFYSYIFNIFFIPILFFFFPPSLPPLHTLPIFLALGIVGIGYLYPYYKGLKSDDTSVVISFFAIGRIFVPVLAFLIVGERLEIVQYLGIALIILSTFMLGIHYKKNKFKMSKAFWYIAAAAFLIALEGVFLKLLFENGVSVSTAVGGESIIGLVLAVCILGFKKTRNDIKVSLPLVFTLSPIFFLEELLTFLGQYTESYAISLNSLTVVKGITMSAPFFVLIYAWFGHNLFPSIFKENLHKRNIIKKVFLFFVLTIGVVLLKD